MAITKMISVIHPQKGGSSASLKRAIDYVANPRKTDGYVHGQGCMPFFHAYEEMMQTKWNFGKAGRSEHERLGYHFLISFSPEEKVSSDTALEVAKEFCEKYLKEYECILGVHNDKGHKHVHIVFNSVNYETGRKYRYEDGEWAAVMQPLVDEICKKHGLHTLSEDTGIQLEEYEKRRKQRKRKKPGTRQKGTGYDPWNASNQKQEGFDHDDMLRHVIDKAVIQSQTFSEFINTIRSYGYLFEKRGKFWRIKAPGKKNFRRVSSLGEQYTEEAISNRLQSSRKLLPIVPVHPDAAYQFPIRMRYMRVMFTPYTDFQKQEYIRLYKLGIRPVKEKPDYRKITNAWKEIRAITRRMEFMKKEQISSLNDLDNKIENIKEELKQIDKQYKNLYRLRYPHKKVLKLYKEKEKWKDYHQAFSMGLSELKPEEKRYQEILSEFLSELSAYHISEEDIVRFLKDFNSQKNYLNSKKKEWKEKLKICEDLQKKLKSFDQKAAEHTKIESEYKKIQMELKQEEIREKKPRKRTIR